MRDVHIVHGRGVSFAIRVCFSECYLWLYNEGRDEYILNPYISLIYIFQRYGIHTDLLPLAFH